MGNLLTYLKWRGDLSFEQSPLCEVDVAILTQIAFLNFKDLVFETVPLSVLCEKFFEQKRDELPKGAFSPLDPFGLLKEIKNSKRFANVHVSNVLFEVVKQNVMQLGALTFSISPQTRVVVFSGTDDSIVGWKENFRMLSQSHTAGQKSAVDYLNHSLDDFDGELIVAGHSKGGNFAIYASIFANEHIQAKIKNVVTFDPQGFSQENFDKAKQSSIANKLFSFVPQDSIIGRLFLHPEKQIITKSLDVGLFQHDLFMWVVDKTEFVRQESFSQMSQSITLSLNDIITNMSNKTRSQFINAFESWIDATNCETLVDLTKNWTLMFPAYRKLSQEDKKILAEPLKKILANREFRSFLWKLIGHKTPQIT